MRSRTSLYVNCLFLIVLIFLIRFYNFTRISTWTSRDFTLSQDNFVDNSSEKDIIHIAMIVVDSETPEKSQISVCERVETLLKSILVFYTGQVHLHLLTNTRSGKTLSTLFRTWPVARVRTSFYNVEDDQKSLEWVNSTHEVSGYGQLKYVIDDILPEYVEKVIFIDTDMLLLEDIGILHSYFSEMVEKGVMFASTSDQYNRNDLEKSLGEGASLRSVNSGLLLFNLKQMREGGWGRLWRESAVQVLNKIGTLACPQDLLAAVAISRPDTYLKLPCEYNFQIGRGALLYDCVKNDVELWKVKIPHWTGKKKYYETNGHAAVFSPIYRCFQKMDGYEFERKSGVVKYRSLLNLRNTKRGETKDDITLAVHVPFNESIELIQRLNTNWHGPISLVICGSSWDRAQLLSFIFLHSLHDQLEVHFVYSRNKSCPIEYLRNMAIDTSRTSTLLISDSISALHVDDELRSKLLRSNYDRSVSVLYSEKESTFRGVVIGKTFAQRLAAGTTGLEEGAQTLKLKINNVKVNAPSEYFKQINGPNWKLEIPSDSFCQQEINRRRNMIEMLF